MALAAHSVQDLASAPGFPSEVRGPAPVVALGSLAAADCSGLTSAGGLSCGLRTKHVPIQGMVRRKVRVIIGK